MCCTLWVAWSIPYLKVLASTSFSQVYHFLVLAVRKVSTAVDWDCLLELFPIKKYAIVECRKPGGDSTGLMQADAHRSYVMCVLKLAKVTGDKLSSQFLLIRSLWKQGCVPLSCCHATVSLLIFSAMMWVKPVLQSSSMETECRKNRSSERTQ